MSKSESQGQNCDPTTADDSNRHDIELRDVRDGQLIASYNHVEHGRTFTEAYHASVRLPMECLTLFEDGTVDVAELTEEERAWLHYEDEKIDFGGAA